jgi:ADP-ribosylglycohydrolase
MTDAQIFLVFILLPAWLFIVRGIYRTTRSWWIALRTEDYNVPFGVPGDVRFPFGGLLTYGLLSAFLAYFTINWLAKYYSISVPLQWLWIFLPLILELICLVLFFYKSFFKGMRLFQSVFPPLQPSLVTNDHADSWGAGKVISVNRTESAIGCMLGTAVGDALGLACEGLSKNRQKRWFPSLNGYHLLFGKGLCSDDTEHTCMLAQSIIVSGGDEALFARDFAWRLRWWLVGLPAGIGLATLRSIMKLWLFVPTSWRGVYSAGNGPAMRSALIGVCFADDEPRLVSINREATRLTHTDPKAECGALAIALAARCSMQGQEFKEFIVDLERLTERHGEASSELVNLATRAQFSVVAGESTEEFAQSLGCKQGVSGYMYHSVPVVLHAWLSHPQDYSKAVTAIIRCGGDSDTTAAMVGAIVGAKVGKSGIPRQWLDDLIEWPRTPSWIEVLAQKAEQAALRGKPGKTQPLSIVGLALRNLVFFFLVLAHGVRRMLPPY